MDFPHEVRFFAGIGPAHFPAETIRPLGRGCLPFSPSCFIVFCYISLLFSIRLKSTMQSYEKDFWHCHLLSLFVTFCHLSANCFFTLQSYEKGFWHCPHLSAYDRKCPLLSAFLFRCKVTKRKFGTVQICPFMSI